MPSSLPGTQVQANRNIKNMRHIQTEITIAAQPETIWKVLMDFENFQHWNPFIKFIEGGKGVGKNLTVKIQPPGGKEMTFKPEILVFEPDQELRWLGRGPKKGLFDGEHYFKIEQQDDTTCKLVHGEKFSGMLVGFMKKTLDKTEEGFQQMNEALKKECER